MSYFFPKSNGLLYSLLFGSIAGLVVLKNGRFPKNSLKGEFEWSSIKSLMLKYKNFPIYSVPTSFVYLLSIQLPVFLIGLLFHTKDVGFYSLAFSIVSIPASILGTVLYN